MNVSSIAQKEQSVFQEAVIAYIEEHADQYITSDYEAMSLELDLEDSAAREGLQVVLANLTEEEEAHLLSHDLLDDLVHELLCATNFYAPPFRRLMQTLEEMAVDMRHFHQDPLGYHGMQQSDFV